MFCSAIVKYGESFTRDNWFFENITRPFSVIYYSIDGTAFYRMGDKTEKMKKGCLYIFPSNTAFSLFEDTSDKFYHLYIHAFLHPQLKTLIVKDVSKDMFLSRIIDFIRAYAKPNKNFYIKILTELLISYISESTEETDCMLHFKIKQYLDENFLTVFKNNNLTDIFHYSNSYLIKVFKSIYGITPKQYVNQLSLKYIANLLNNDYSVNTISNMLNYSSPENFSRFFKNNYGCSPTEYAKLSKQNNQL